MVAEKKVAKKDKAEVAQKSFIPRGMEDIGNENIIKPRIIINQALSPAVVDGKAQAGTLMNNITEFVYGKELKFQPIKGFITRIKWVPRPEGGGIDCRSFDGQLGNTYGDCYTCKFKAWKQDGTPPECDEIWNFLGLIWDDGAPQIAIASFAKTSWKAGKQFASKIKFDSLTHRRDSWGKIYTLSTKSQKNEHGQFFILDTDGGEMATEEQLMEGEMAYTAWADKIKEVAENIDYADAESDLTDADEVADNDIPF
jgi:hypothetical protein